MATEKFSNDAESTLVGSINASDTSISVASATTFPTQPQFRLRIDSEILLVTAVSGNTLTVTRGAEGSTAASHNSGAEVIHILTAGALDQLKTDTLAAAPAPTFGTTAGTSCEGNDSRLSNDRTASGFRTASTVVTIASATPPTVGQVLTATSDSAATWQTPPTTEVVNNILTVFGDVSATESPVPLAIGSAYVPVLSYSGPSASVAMQSLGYRLNVWEEQVTGSEFASCEELLVSVKRVGSTYVLTNVETGTSGAFLTGTLTSGVSWKVEVNTGNVVFSVQQTTTARRAHARVWAGEEVTLAWS